MDQYDWRIHSTCEHLQGNPSATVSELKVRVDLSASGLQHLFKEAEGVSIGQYAKELKLHLAAELLSSTNDQIKVIRIKAGIPDASNFSHAFKDKFGSTATAYRKRFSRINQQIARSTN